MTVRFKNELVRNITIKLGYANAKVCAYALLRACTLGCVEEGVHVPDVLLDLQMRKRGLSTTGKLPLIPLRQRGQPTMRTTRLRTPDGTHPSRLIRRLSRARYSDGHHVERCSGHGRRTPSHRSQRNVSATPDIGALGGRRDHETRTSHHSPK